MYIPYNVEFEDDITNEQISYYLENMYDDQEKNICINLHDDISICDDDDDTNEGEEPGTVVTHNSPIGRIDMVAPEVTYNYNRSGRNSYVRIDSIEYNTVFKSSNYHLKDSNWITNYHKIVNGKIREWRRSMLKIFNKLDNTHNMNRNTYKKQLDFAQHRALKIQFGISNFNDFPVHILNHKNLIEMIDGIESEEQAEFVIWVSNSRVFEITPYIKQRSNEINVVTVFDSNYSVIFGK